MIEKDNYNLYKIEDDLDDSGLNYSNSDNYVLKEEDEREEEEKKVYPFLLMIKILLSPVEGWKSVRRSKLSIEKIQSDCFYPLLAILAALCFLKLLYNPNTNISHVVIQGMISFVSFFFGYFTILIFLGIFLPMSTKHVFKSDFGKIYILYSLSTLVLFCIFIEIVPVLWPVLIFLPLWTIFCMCKGMRFFKLPERGTVRFTFVVCLLVIGVPLIIDRILEGIIPV